MTEYRFIEPHDVLFFRGNRLFGDAPGGGNALMPPWPSVFAGALRTAMAVANGANPASIKDGSLPEPLADCLGSAADPGSFTLSEVTLARRTSTGVETLHPLPADLAVYWDEGELVVHRLQPVTPPTGIRCGSATKGLPMPRRDERGQPEDGYWLTRAGWSRYLLGHTPAAEHLCHRSELWTSDPRLGIGLDAERGATRESQLYTTEGIRLAPNVGFLVAVDGVPSGTLPEHTTLRLGGDGRAASLDTVAAPEEVGPDRTALANDSGCRLVLTSPGIFPQGWQLPGLAGDRWPLPGGTARLQATAIPRATTVSGWDVAHNHPKPAVRAAPTGSVYWLSGIDSDPDELCKLASSGLWGLCDHNHSASRRAEGFNRCVIANA